MCESSIEEMRRFWCGVRIVSGNAVSATVADGRGLAPSAQRGAAQASPSGCWRL